MQKHESMFFLVISCILNDRKRSKFVINQISNVKTNLKSFVELHIKVQITNNSFWLWSNYFIWSQRNSYKSKLDQWLVEDYVFILFYHLNSWEVILWCYSYFLFKSMLSIFTCSLWIRSDKKCKFYYQHTSTSKYSFLIYTCLKSYHKA